MANNDTNNRICMLKTMSSEELQELLRLDIYADNSDEIDSSDILKILEVLEERNEVDKTKKSPDVDSAYQSFLENYLPYVENAESLYEWDNDTTEIKSLSPEDKNPYKNANRHRRFINYKRLGLVAAVFIVFSVVFFNTTALGSSVWQSIAHWGRTTFSFSESSASIHISDELVPLHEALTEHGIKELIIPGWIPDRFELVDVNVHELPEETAFTALLGYEENVLVIQIRALQNQHMGAVYERNDEDVYIFHRNGIDHYIMTNMDLVIAVWRNQNYECSFSGNITEGEAMIIINSIYEG